MKEGLGESQGFEAYGAATRRKISEDLCVSAGAKAAMMRSSCTECRRRKQKCSGDWPCRRCADRRLAHVCHFQNLSTVSEQTTAHAQSTTKFLPRDTPASLQKDAHPSVSCRPGYPAPGDQVSPPSSDFLGYADGLKHLGLSYLNEERSKPSGEMDVGPCEEMQRALQTLPTRSLTDMLVNQYLQHGNYTYFIVQPESFLQDYERWCSTPASKRSTMKPFACLLLEVCALALQGLAGELGRQIEYDLGESTEVLSQEFHSVAVQLSKILRPGTGGLHQGLQWLLAAGWAKGEGSFTEAWHYVAAAAREEQECGMHRAEASDDLSEIETELRTRLWCSTVLWDWQMSEWLCRPMLVDQKVADLKLANLKLDQIEEGALSPFSNKFSQYTLVYRLASQFGRLSSPKEPAEVFEIQKTIDEWASELPRELAPFDPDTTKDTTHPWILIQRTQLHCFVQMVRLTPVRSFILQPKSDVDDHDRTAMRQYAVTTALACIDSALRLLQVLPWIQTRFHFVIFVLFDTSAAICSAIIQDHKRDLPSRERLLQSVALGIAGIERLPPKNGSAIAAASFLRRLSARIPVSDEELPLLQQICPGHLNISRPSSPPNLVPAESVFSSLNGTSPAQASIPEIDASMETSVPDTSTWESIPEFDLGTMNEIWDYTSLNLPDDMLWGKDLEPQQLP